MKRAFVFLIMSAVLCLAGEPWRFSRNDRGTVAVSRGETAVLQAITLEAYSKNYRKLNYRLENVAFAEKNGSVQLTQGNDFCKAQVSVTAAENSLTIALEADIAEEQHLEFGLLLDPKLMANKDGKMTIVNQGRSQVQDKGKTIITSQKGFAMETPAVDYEFKNSGTIPFSFQDKRDTMNCFRYIGVANSIDNGGKKHIRETITLTVKPYTGKELAVHKARLNASTHSVTRRITVSNSNFDQGLEGWTHSENASADIENAINGQCAKLVVNDPMKDNVYITRLVPCVEGAHYKVSCKIKTENVTAVDGQMPAVGACMVVEWADKKGEWMAGGVYSQGYYGTNDWTNVVCNGLRAPADSGYLSIFLAVRGKGTAWFEEFDVVQTQQSIAKVLPEDGCELDTNAPEFRWMPMNDVDTYTVELSRSKDFPADATQKYLVDVVPVLQLRTVLQPGVWYWRVSATGYEDSTPWKMNIAVPASRNMVPPLIAADHGRVLSPAEPYVFEAEGTVTARFQDGTGAFAVSSNGNRRGIVPDGGWRNGLNSIVINAVGSNGVTAEKAVWIACAPKPQNVVVIDKEGRYTENGRHIFPLGIYEVAEKYMAEVRQSGFEVVHSYQWEGSQDDVAAGKYLDACVRNGLRCFIGYDRGTSSGDGIVQGNLEHIARRTATFAAHPGIFCWYLFDEPERVEYYVPPKKLTMFAELVRKLDPYHPVVMTTWGRNMNKYRKTWDTHWTQSGYSTPDVAVDIYTQQYDLLLHDSPITMVMHCYDKVQSRSIRLGEAPNWDAFFPDYACMRADALVGISKNINGLWWWWYAKDSSTWLTAAQNPKAWENMKAVIAEIISLRPILNAAGEVQMGTVTVGAAKVEWWSKRVDGKDYVIAVNTSEKEVEATVAPKGVKPFKVKLGRWGCFINFGSKAN